jgi:hypothetical protein
MSNTRTIFKVDTCYDDIPDENEIVRQEKENEEKFKDMSTDDIYNVLEDNYGRYFIDEVNDGIINKLNEVYFAYNIGYKKQSIGFLMNCLEYIVSEFGLDYDCISLKIKDNTYISHNKKNINIANKDVDEKIEPYKDINNNNIKPIP